MKTTPSIAFWFRIEMVESGLISVDDVFQKQWILVKHGNYVSRSFRPFCILLICELVRKKSGAELPLTQIIANDGVRRVFANAQFLHNQSWRQSPILCQHLSRFLNHLWGSACRCPTRTWLILSRFFPFAKAFGLLVNTFSAHGFPAVHTEPLQFSPICSRTWCLHVASLRCDTTSHTDYVQVAAAGYCRSHAVHAVCRFSQCLWITMLMRALMRHVAIQIWHNSPNFVDTLVYPVRDKKTEFCKIF